MLTYVIGYFVFGAVSLGKKKEGRGRQAMLRYRNPQQQPPHQKQIPLDDYLDVHLNEVAGEYVQQQQPPRVRRATSMPETSELYGGLIRMVVALLQLVIMFGAFVSMYMVMSSISRHYRVEQADRLQKAHKLENWCVPYFAEHQYYPDECVEARARLEQSDWERTAKSTTRDVLSSIPIVGHCVAHEGCYGLVYALADFSHHYGLWMFILAALCICYQIARVWRVGAQTRDTFARAANSNILPQHIEEAATDACLSSAAAGDAYYIGSSNEGQQL